MNSVIDCTNIVKTFKRRGSNECVRAVDDISFSLEGGKIVGLLGPDGAGKTTLLRMLAGLYRPDSGHAETLSFDIVKEAPEIQKIIGYMPQKFGLYENLSVEENLTLYADLHGVLPSERAERFDSLFEMTDLSRFRDRMAGALSGGMKQKLALACALVSNPPLLLLDEPTVGVDILSRRELWQILRKLTDGGHLSVFASTAYMDEATYCDRTLIMFKGKLIADSTPQEICSKVADIVEKPSFEDGFMYLLSGSLPPPVVRSGKVDDTSEIVVKADSLVKKFGSFTAVDHVSFNVHKGEIFGLLGANGAGKTTTFRMLCGLSATDGGTIEIAGVNLRLAAGNARRKIGYVAQKFSLYGDLTVYENLEFFGGAYGLTMKKLKERIAWAEEQFELSSIMNLPSGKLPLGFKQRLSMAAALLHEPEILFLDEATSGADPMARRDFWRRITNLADDGVAVIITTHFLDEAVYCDRMVIMDAGKSIASGSADDIRKAGNNPVLEEAFVNIIANAKKEPVNK